MTDIGGRGSSDQPMDSLGSNATHHSLFLSRFGRMEEVKEKEYRDIFNNAIRTLAKTQKGDVDEAKRIAFSLQSRTITYFDTKGKQHFIEANEIKDDLDKAFIELVEHTNRYTHSQFTPNQLLDYHGNLGGRVGFHYSPFLEKYKFLDGHAQFEKSPFARGKKLTDSEKEDVDRIIKTMEQIHLPEDLVSRNVQEDFEVAKNEGQLPLYFVRKMLSKENIRNLPEIQRAKAIRNEFLNLVSELRKESKNSWDKKLYPLDEDLATDIGALALTSRSAFFEYYYELNVTPRPHPFFESTGPLGHLFKKTSTVSAPTGERPLDTQESLQQEQSNNDNPFMHIDPSIFDENPQPTQKEQGNSRPNQEDINENP